MGKGPELTSMQPCYWYSDKVEYVCGFIKLFCITFRERMIIGSVSYRNRYWAYRIGYFCIGRITQEIKEWSAARECH